ncbi:hypothetical protein [Paracidovorax valerianellae]|uniref:hypothetical protein n=1 Tax=Paracidovorax valerianellae TaxID=187868 RepID=UPI0011141A17|nr:hypothetical protein [Paracidovorax valerianellae]MDA8443448.1 hypothetical protein [Paracidovorax valerianellae]
MKNQKKIKIFISLLLSFIGAVWFLKKINTSELENLIPKERCVKSAYSDDSENHRISINCKDYDGNVHTVMLRKFYKKEELEKLASVFKNGVEVNGFLCTELNSLHTCFSRKQEIMITSTVEESVVFFALQFGK